MIVRRLKKKGFSAKNKCMKQIAFNSQVKQLLAESDLPFSDLLISNKVSLYAHEEKGQLVGLVGLEQYGNDALLRSLVISPDQRGTGLGIRFVNHAEDQAVSRGVKTVYLLTTTANTFFQRLGYNIISREQAPETIRSTTQFSSLCPDSATLMCKCLSLRINLN